MFTRFQCIPGCRAVLLACCPEWRVGLAVGAWSSQADGNNIGLCSSINAHIRTRLPCSHRGTPPTGSALNSSSCLSAAASIPAACQSCRDSTPAIAALAVSFSAIHCKLDEHVAPSNLYQPGQRGAAFRACPHGNPQPGGVTHTAWLPP
jgi:hypothetical protein